MPDYELHADYDRNGRLSAMGGEYDSRLTSPGAIVLANLDADARRLPERVSAGGAVTLDWQQPTKTATDNDLLQLLVRVVRPSAAPGSQFFVKVVGGSLAARVALYDRTGQRVQRVPGGFNQYPVTPGRTPLELRLEATTLPGSPLAHPATLSRGRSATSIDEGDLVLQLLSIDGGGVVTVHDSGHVTVAPSLIADNTAQARRMYICEIGDNEPSLEDVRRAFGSFPTVELVTVPLTVSFGDCWLQDQFQPVVCEGPSTSMEVVVHLPRLRANVVQSALTPNLGSFVTNHFPSRNLGVFQDFWRRSVPIRDASGGSQQIPFERSHETQVEMQRVFLLRTRLFDTLAELEVQRDRPDEPGTWFEALGTLPTLASEVIAEIDRRRRGADTDARRAALQNRADDLRQRLAAIQQRFPIRGELVTLPLPDGATAEVARDEADELFRRLFQMHHSFNYGGNIEASPPTSDARLGKVVVGNIHFEDGSDAMDPDVLRFFTRQLQPVVEVDTSWLDVGHVDEIMTFVPDLARRSFAALRASPGVALALIRAARMKHWEGLPDHHPYKFFYRPSGILSRSTADGQTPVTHLLRGKLWLHHHPREALQVLEPPLIYRKMADVDSRGISVHDIRYWHGEGPDRQYPAGMSVHEIIHFERDVNGDSVNDFIEENFMHELDDQLRRDFREVPVLGLPVVFDAVRDLAAWRDNKRLTSTAAFTPNLVNMQVINGHLLVPRPYGPRMRPRDSIAVLRSVLDERGLGRLGGRLGERYFARRGLDATPYWVRREAPVHVETSAIGTVESIFSGIDGIDDVVRFFKDSFPGSSDEEVRRRILQANRRDFQTDGRLRDGWRLLSIPGGTVDLFEAWTTLVADSLGLTLHWVDSWFYHVRFGEIHCGTNVIRGIGRRTQPPWWVRVETVEFEDDVISPE